MLLIVSSFGESRRRANHPAAALLKSHFLRVVLGLFSSSGDRRAVDGQNNEEGAPLPKIGFDPYATLMCIYNALDDRQSQT
jgi:hypothetical protein